MPKLSGKEVKDKEADLKAANVFQTHSHRQYFTFTVFSPETISRLTVNQHVRVIYSMKYLLV